MSARTLLTYFLVTVAIALASCGQEESPVPVPAVLVTAVQTQLPATPIPTITPSATAEPQNTPTVTAEPQQKTPDLRYLQAAIEETLDPFEGFSSYVVTDLQTGQTIARNEDVALAGMSLVKVPILINTYRVLYNPPNIEQTKLITETTALSSNFAANLLLQTIAGKPDAYEGADIVSQSMRDLGIYNTFIAVPIDADPRPDRINTVLTPANQRTDITTFADPFRQTTTGDLTQLFHFIYECAENDAGPLREKYPDQITTAECQELVDFMQLNELARLLENGLPAEVPFAHKVGWIDDTHGDGGIVYSPGGNYLITMALYAPSWLEWEDSAPLFESVSQQTYAHFNEPNLYEGVEIPLEPTPNPATPTPDLPHAVVTNTQGIGLTIRDVPGGAEMAILPDGSILTLLEAEPVEHNGYRWHKVLTADGKTGWAVESYFAEWTE